MIYGFSYGCKCHNEFRRVEKGTKFKVFFLNFLNFQYRPGVYEKNKLELPVWVNK